jgi:hypothetical protein
MIIILQQNDVLKEYRDQPVENLQLSHLKLLPRLVDQAELIAFVEGSAIKFFKHFPEIQSKNSLDVLMYYLGSAAPTTKEQQPFRLKRSKHWKKKE